MSFSNKLNPSFIKPFSINNWKAWKSPLNFSLMALISKKHFAASSRKAKPRSRSSTFLLITIFKARRLETSPFSLKVSSKSTPVLLLISSFFSKYSKASRFFFLVNARANKLSTAGSAFGSTSFFSALVAIFS